MSLSQIILLCRRRGDVPLHRLRDVQAGEILNGLLSHHPRPGRHSRARLALPRFVHGRGLRRTRALPRLHRATDLPDARHESRTRADLEALRRRDDHLHGRLYRLYLRDHTNSGLVALESPALWRRRTGVESQYGDVIRDQHQLAELRRRNGDVVFLPDGRPHRTAVRQPGRGYRRRHRAGTRLLAS
jgi:hypothetical protein